MHLVGFHYRNRPSICIVSQWVHDPKKVLCERYLLSRMYVCACVMCAVFHNRSSGVAPEHNTHSAKNVPNNLFSVHDTSWEYTSKMHHIRQPRATYHKTRAALRRNIKQERLKNRKGSGTQSKSIPNLGIRRRSEYSFTLQQYHLREEGPGTPIHRRTHWLNI